MTSGGCLVARWVLVGANHLEQEVSRFEKMLEGITRVLAPGVLVTAGISGDTSGHQAIGLS
jgi:hypothetical protein